MESFKSYLSDADALPGQLKCMFGPLKHNDGKTRFFATHGCGHHDYQDLQRSFSRAISTQNVVHTAMVRDPFDRLRSLFDYMHANVELELWKESNTVAQYKHVREGNFAGWLDLVYQEKKTPHRKQYAYIDEDVDKAISLITGDSTNVTVLVNECFEASLRLLENKLALRTGAVDGFLHSKKFQPNMSTQRNATNSVPFAELRERSKRYFEEEYAFYDTAVEQFKRQLYSLDPSLLQGCDL